MTCRTDRKKRILSFILALLTALNTVGLGTPALADGDPDPYTDAEDKGANVIAIGAGSTRSLSGGTGDGSLYQYLRTQHSSHDVLQLHTTGSYFEVGEDAIPLGTKEVPFDGTITINTASDKTFVMGRALFAYLSTNATFEMSDGTPISTIRIVRTSKADNDSALFAEHIVGAGSLSFTIEYVENSLDYDPDYADYTASGSTDSLTYPAVIGEISGGATVDLSYTVPAPASAESLDHRILSRGSAGLLCGTIRADSTLNATLTLGSAYSVESVNGAAGGLVGAMYPGAQLNIQNASALTLTDVSVTADGESAYKRYHYVPTGTGTPTQSVNPSLQSVRSAAPMDREAIAAADDPYDTGADVQSAEPIETSSQNVRNMGNDNPYETGGDVQPATEKTGDGTEKTDGLDADDPYKTGKDAKKLRSPLLRTLNTATGAVYPLFDSTELARLGGCAGGLVGWAQGAGITMKGVTLASPTVTGTAAVGGLIGYYEVTAATPLNLGIVTGANAVTLTDAAVTTGNTPRNDVDPAAGGLFGALKTTAAHTLDLTHYSVGADVAGGSKAGLGGVAGRLEATADFELDGGEVLTAAYNADDAHVTVGFDGGADVGGLVGLYANSDLAHTLWVHDVKPVVTASAGAPTASGGLIGRVRDDDGENDTDAAAYLKINDAAADFRGVSLDGGVVGDMGGLGSFLDLSGTVAVAGKVRGGLVDKLPEGVLRLQGVTDLGGRYLGAGIDTSYTNNNNDTLYHAQLVNERGHALIYALGAGDDAITSGVSDGWTLVRGTANIGGDLYTWGEVLRIDGTNLKEDDLFTVEMDNPTDAAYHTVTVSELAPANSKLTIGSLPAFAKAALNIQLNTGEGLGALQFEGEESGDTLLGKDIDLTASISLAGTGLTGLMRDDGFGPDGETESAFTGTFSVSNDSTLTLAVGEPFGFRWASSALQPLGTAKTAPAGLAAGSGAGAVDAGTGWIYDHGFNGLFARTQDATFENVRLSGSIHTLQTDHLIVKEHAVGGLAAVAKGDLTLTNCDVDVAITNVGAAKENTGVNINVKLRIGGAVGRMIEENGSDQAVITIIGGTYAAQITDLRRETNTNTSIGGVIGFIDQTKFNASVGASDHPVTLAGSFTNADAANTNNVYYGGLIGYITEKGSDIDTKRTLSLQYTTVTDMDISVNGNNLSCGSILGYKWLNTAVTFGTDGTVGSGVTLGKTVNDVLKYPEVSLGGAATKQGGLVYGATGHWTVHDIQVNKAEFTPTANNQIDFGVLVCYGGVSSNSLYLEIPCDVAPADNAAGLNLDGVYATEGDGIQKGGGNNFKTYDEIIAYSTKPNSTDIMANGAAVVSIRTTDGAPVVMSASGCNTYQNQTDYGKSAATSITRHKHSRYYYNLDTIQAEASPSDGKKLLLWSVQTYAGSNLSTYFSKAELPNGNSAVTCDLRGLSYYPVSASGVTMKNAIIVFDNEGFEESENNGGGSDGIVRSSRADTQHYLLHSGILYDAGQLSVSDLTLQGTVGGMADGSGFLVRGTLVDKVGTSSTVSSVYLDGASVRLGATTPAGKVGGSSYAPLLINRAGSDSADKPLTLRVSGVMTNWTGRGSNTPTPHTNYSSLAAGEYAASSLIGRVGDVGTNGEEGKKLQLTFSDIRLDARKIADAVPDETVTQKLNEAYATTRSIFGKATLLDCYRYTGSDSSGAYNFALSEDWSGATTPVHHVTYGYEIANTDDGAAKYWFDANADAKQAHYLDGDGKDSGVFISPVESAAEAMYTLFHDRTKWLPYVATSGATGREAADQELKINHATKTTLEKQKDGCGSVNHPYLIKDADQFVKLAKLIAGEMPESSFLFRLPTAALEIGTVDAVDPACDVYFWNGSAFENQSNSKKTYTPEKVRQYLAGAYYQIGADFTIAANSGYPGLGQDSTNTNTTNQYLFRGVIYGCGFTITNKTNKPLISNSNGCVVKDLNLAVKDLSYTESLTVYDTNADHEFADNAGNSAKGQTYGALIGKVWGGDTFIDGVGVSFTGTTTVTPQGDAARLIPIGGYIGTVVNGGVIFRNMDDVVNDGLTSDKCALVTDEGDSAGWLYVNPIIGRVVAGYAFSEDCTVNNGAKNYDIPQLDSALAPLSAESSGNVINVDNGQALWVLAAVINSGSGAANTSGNNIDKYSSTSRWYACRSYTAVRAGTRGEIDGESDPARNYLRYQSSVTDSGSTDKTPYLISAYVAAGSVTLIRKAGNLTQPTVRFRGSSITGVPTGFKGIGSIYSKDSALRLNSSDKKEYKLIGVQTNDVNPVVTLNMDVREYAAYGNASALGNYGKPDWAYAGVGIINYTATTDDKLKVENLTVTGTVNYTMREELQNANYRGYPIIVVFSNQPMCAGGVVGSIQGTVTMTNVKMGNLTVNGVKHAAGLIGRMCSNATCTMTNCGSLSDTALQLSSAFGTGGLIGESKRPTSITITSTETGGSTVNIGRICNRYTLLGNRESLNNTAKSQLLRFYGGGLIGDLYMDSDYTRPVTIRNMNVKGVAVPGVADSPVITSNFSSDDTNFAKREDGVGGLIGSVGPFIEGLNNGGVASGSGFQVTIQSCSVEDLTLEGKFAGGALGWTNNVSTLDLRDLTVSGVTVNGHYSAGGALGWLYQSKNLTPDVHLRSVTVKNSTVSSLIDTESSATKQDRGAGGLIGSVYRASGTLDMDLADCAVNTVTVSAAYPSENGAHGAGGLVGTLNTNAVTLTGHDLLVYALTLTQTKNKTNACGTLIGNNPNGASTVKLVGVSVQKHSANGPTPDSATPVGSNVTTTTPLGSDGYLVYADRGGKALLTPNGLDSVLYGQDASHPDFDTSLGLGTAHMAASPYVTVTPGVRVSTADPTAVLTGDGMANAVANLQHQSWLTSNFGADALSLVSTETKVACTDADVAVIVVKAGDASLAKLKDYVNELTGWDDADDQLQTNGTISSVSVWRMKWNSEDAVFEKSSSSSLRWSDSQGFYVSPGKADNDNQSFSLIDVAYKDPAGSGTTVYHLYIPVLVRRVLEYDFTCRVLPGTNYLPSAYTTSWQAMENIGSPLTLHFTYAYRRDAAAWQAALEGGEPESGAFRTRLQLQLQTSDDSLGLPPGSSVLVLVDQQTGLSYYARWSAAYVRDGTKRVLDLGAFHRVLDDQTSDAFTAQTVSELLNVTVTQSATGAFVECAEGEDVQFTAACDGSTLNLRLYDEELDTSSPTRYEIASNNGDLTQSYFLSIFTEEDKTTPANNNWITHFAVDCESELAGQTAGTTPSTYCYNYNAGRSSRISDIVIGNVYTITLGTPTVRLWNADHNAVGNATKTGDGQAQILDSSHHTIEVDVSGTIRLNNASSYSPFLPSTIYHSFMLMLGGKDYAGDPISGISGAPEVSGTYRIDGGTEVSYGESWTGSGAALQFAVPEQTASALATALEDGQAHTISAHLTLEYPRDPERQALQFPQYNENDVDKQNNSDKTGVWVSIRSCFSEKAEDVAYSNLIKETKDESQRFCTDPEVMATLTYAPQANAVKSESYSSLGINPWDEDNTGVSHVDTVASFDYTGAVLHAADATDLKVELELKYRYDEYATALPLADYWQSLNIGGSSVTVGSAGTKATVYFSKDTYENAAENSGALSWLTGSVSIPISFDVLTGTTWEEGTPSGSNTLAYSNYKVCVKVSLVKRGSGVETTIAAPDSMEEYAVVYTNARLLTGWVS